MRSFQFRDSRVGTRRAASLRFFLAILVCSLLILQSSAVRAANYVFDVLYFGEDIATLVPGSDDPNATTVVDGDTFQWSITAQGGAYWLVETGGEFFPLMAFFTDPGGVRTGDFELQLLNNGLEVFALSETDVDNSEIHIGTNTVTLDTGLAFDEMRLDYTLTEAIGNLELPIESHLIGLLPIFGAPENNRFYPGIVYIVPEPTALSICLMGMAIATFKSRPRHSI